MPRKKDYLTDEEKDMLPILLAEAQTRGLLGRVQRQQDLIKRRVNRPFPKDKDGYYYRYDGRKFIPNTEDQANFVKSLAYFVAYRAGRGSGKTAAGSQKVLPKIEAGEPGIIMNPDFENLKISTWPEFREWIPWDRVVHTQRFRKNPDWTPNGPFTLVFDTGAWVIVKGVKDPQSARGPNVNWLWYDEAERDRSGEAWQIASASVRISKTGMPTQRIVTTTPNWQAPWAKKLFRDKEIPKDALEEFNKLGTDIPLVEQYTGTPADNKSNLDPIFYASLLSQYVSGYLRDQEVSGKDVNPSGVLGNASWFNNRVLDKAPDSVEKRIRYYDIAGAERKRTGKKSLDPDYNVGTLLSWIPKPKADIFVIEEQESGRWTWEALKEKIAAIAQRDGPYVTIYIEQEPGSGGINQVEEIKLYIRDHVGPQWTVKEHKPEGDKVQRANPWFAEAERGQFYIVKGTWNSDFLNQLGNFPEDAHDDLIDSVSGARQIIAPFKSWSRAEFLFVGGDEFKLDNEKDTEDDVIMGL